MCRRAFGLPDSELFGTAGQSLEEAAFEALVPLLGDDGTLTRIRTSCYTTAHAAGSEAA